MYFGLSAIHHKKFYFLRGDIKHGVKCRIEKEIGYYLICYGLLVVEMVFGYFILESRQLFWENSVKHGGYLAQAQTEKIETQMQGYAFSVELAGKYLDDMVNMHLSKAQIQQWMKSYCEKITERFGNNVLDIYAVLDGSIVAANPWEGDDNYDFLSKPWYTDAVAAESGTIVFSDLYQDAVTGQNVFTMSLALSDPHNVVAIDVYLTSENWMGFSELADGYGLLVYDPHQTLAYSIGHIDLSSIHTDILAATSSEVSHYAGSVKEDYNLYMCKLSSGWNVVIAIPRENLISPKHMLLMNLGLGLNVVNMAIATTLIIRHLHNSRYIRQDALTGLLNKSYLMKQIRKRLKKSDGTLLIIDLDNFKMVNDNYGHDHGDLVLMRVAEVLQTCFRKTDCIGRFGGDEFIIYVDEFLSDTVLNDKVQEVLRQVAVLASQYPLSGLAISIGGCHCKKDDKYSEAFKRADEALYEVKNNGKCGFAISTTCKG